MTEITNPKISTLELGLLWDEPAWPQKGSHKVCQPQEVNCLCNVMFLRGPTLAWILTLIPSHASPPLEVRIPTSSSYRQLPSPWLGTSPTRHVAVPAIWAPRWSDSQNSGHFQNIKPNIDWVSPERRNSSSTGHCFKGLLAAQDRSRYITLYYYPGLQPLTFINLINHSLHELGGTMY